MSTLLAWPDPTEQHGYDAVAAYADLDLVLLASLRTPADEDAIAAAVETQRLAKLAAFPAQRRRAHSPVELRAA